MIGSRNCNVASLIFAWTELQLLPRNNIINNYEQLYDNHFLKDNMDAMGHYYCYSFYYYYFEVLLFYY